MRNTIQYRPSGNRAEVEGEFARIIGQRRDVLHCVRQLHDGVRAVPMLSTSVRAAPGDGDAPGRPALARDDHEPFFAQPSFRLEDQCHKGVAVEPAPADVAEVLRQRLLRRIPEQFPGDFLELGRRLFPQRLQHQPHHYRAALDVVRARAVDAVPFRLPVKLISRFLLGRKHRIEMRHHRDTPLRAAWPGQNQVIAVIRIRRRHELRSESEWRETLRREPPQLIHPLAIAGEAIDADHLAQ